MRVTRARRRVESSDTCAQRGEHALTNPPLASRREREVTMPAYFIIDLDIHDPAGFSAYVSAAGPVLEKFGARYLVAGPKG